MNNSTFITNALAKITRVTLSAKHRHKNLAQPRVFLTYINLGDWRMRPAAAKAASSPGELPRGLRRGSHSVIIR